MTALSGPLRNEALLSVVTTHAGDAEALYEALIEREDGILDELRVAAAMQGLMPGLTAFTLCQSGLGTPVTAEVFALLQQQAYGELERLQQMMREAGDPDESGEPG